MRTLRIFLAAWGRDGGLSALLCAWRVVLLHGGDGTAGADPGERHGTRSVARGLPGGSPTLAVPDRCAGPAARSSACDLDSAAGRCGLFETLGRDQETLHAILVGRGRIGATPIRLAAPVSTAWGVATTFLGAHPAG